MYVTGEIMIINYFYAFTSVNDSWRHCFALPNVNMKCKGGN